MPSSAPAVEVNNHAAKDRCLLAADNDHAAISAWFSGKAGAGLDGETLSSMQRSYRKGAERLLLWAVLRRAEMTAAICGDLEQVDVRRPDGRLTPGWLQTVRGKGGRIRQVPVLGCLVEELGPELGRLLRPGDALDERNWDIHFLTVLDDEVSELTTWSTFGLYQAIKRSMICCAANIKPGDPAALRRASVHWLRHSHVSHAVNGRPGRTPVGGRL